MVRFTTVIGELRAGRLYRDRDRLRYQLTWDDAVLERERERDAGTVTLTRAGSAWTGSMAVGGTVTITDTVTVNNPDTGSKVLVNKLTTTTTGSNCASGGTDMRCTATVTDVIRR